MSAFHRFEPHQRHQAATAAFRVFAAGTYLCLITLANRADAHPDDPRRPAAIETSGSPIVRSEVFDRLAQYANIRSAGFSGWEPSGRGILISTRFGNSNQLHRVYEPGGRREQITFFEEPVQGGFLSESPSGEILLQMSKGGDENFQVYLLDPENHRTVLLTDGTSRNQLNTSTVDGSRIVVASNRRNGRDTDLFIADPRKPDSMRPIMETNAEFWSAADWSRDGTKLLVGQYVSINEGYYALIDTATGQRTDIKLPSDENAGIGGLAFSADSKSIFLTIDSQGEFRQLAQYDIASGEYTWITSDIPWDVSSLTVARDSGLVAFTINEDGASQLYLYDGQQRQQLELPLGIASSLEFSPDGKHLGLTLARPDAPSDAYSIRLSDRTLTRWTYSEVGGLNPASFVTPTRIQFESFDGKMIPAYYFRPRELPASGKLPVLISIHGGPEGQYQPSFTGAIQYDVNELGLAVLAPNVRGSSGYGKTYLKLDNGPLREDSVKDIGALLDWIARQPELDASRVVVTGGSYGGYMVLASLTHYPDRIRAGIDNVGIANFITFLERTAPYRQDLRRAEYGDERDPEMRSVFERINPTANAQKIQAALLVAHGKNDPRVPLHEAQQIAEKVRANNRPVWTVFAENEGHGFAKKDNRDYLQGVQTMFLKQHLLGP